MQCLKIYRLVQFYGHAAANALRQMQAAARRVKGAGYQQIQVTRENSGAMQIQTSRLAQ
ncbi:hypothetical protein HB016_000195 [Salmonella enterica subsp. enterica]|nr:hypothetical protein [Salmonella enterica]EEP4630228.1 hypothetical protein [Salmonella enterica subsp. enterica serovar Poano]EEO9896890.1 hypothetical protein [Salmonella enterica]EFO7633016.1 hypothetical protein [Salmonella enterica]EGG8297096.1 hypothetical protein [Salmonella enterica subsp. enterica serovar Poano]